MTENNWKKEAFVQERRTNTRGLHIVKLMEEKGVRDASVVSIGWLFEQLIKCLHNDQETIRIATGREGEIYIETFMDSEYIDGYGGPEGDPEGWNNDWPKIQLP